VLYKKQGYPEESELCLCTVTKVQHNIVFVSLDEYVNKSGIIHISEISPGRIRNIRDYVKEGKKIICKVLRVNLERGHIDLSLRRVNEGQRRLKNDNLKKEQLAEKIIEFVAKELKTPVKELYEKLTSKLSDEHPSVHAFFEDFIRGEFDLKELELDKKTTDKLEEIIRQRIKPPRVELSGTMTIISYDTDGVSIITNALKNGVHDDVEMKYVGAGKYKFVFHAEDYKQCEALISDITEKIISSLEKSGAEVNFERED